MLRVARSSDEATPFWQRPRTLDKGHVPWAARAHCGCRPRDPGAGHALWTLVEAKTSQTISGASVGGEQGPECQRNESPSELVAIYTCLENVQNISGLIQIYSRYILISVQDISRYSLVTRWLVRHPASSGERPLPRSPFGMHLTEVSLRCRTSPFRTHYVTMCRKTLHSERDFSATASRQRSE